MDPEVFWNILNWHEVPYFALAFNGIDEEVSRFAHPVGDEQNTQLIIQLFDDWNTQLIIQLFDE